MKGLPGLIPSRINPHQRTDVNQATMDLIRINRKFDIFLKRFMRQEDEVKEIKNNYYRVMHCTFNRYEPGFNRKKEIWEKKKLKRKEMKESGLNLNNSQHDSDDHLIRAFEQKSDPIADEKRFFSLEVLYSVPDHFRRQSLSVKFMRSNHFDRLR